MGNALVDEVKAELAEQELEPKCPDCGSRVLFGDWVRSYRLNLDTEESEETIGSDGMVNSIYCGCGWHLESN